MTVPEILFTTWVGWPIYMGLALLIGYGAYEHFTENQRSKGV